MKNKLLLLCVLFSALLHADDSTKVKTFKRLYIGASFTGNITYRYLKESYVRSGSTSAEQKEVISWRNKQERPQFGFQGGIRFGINATRWFSIETGLDYNRHRYSFRADNYPFGSRWKGSAHFDSIYANTEVKIIEDYHYLNVPVALNFSLGKRKVKAIISAGVNLNFLVDKTEKYRMYVNGDVVKSDFFPDRSPYSFMNVSPFLGIGVETHIGKTLFVRLMPIAQMQVLENMDAPITEYLWSAGVNASLYFAFKKVK